MRDKSRERPGPSENQASPPRAESSGGESTMLSANFAEAIRGKQALKNCFLFVRGPRF